MASTNKTTNYELSQFQSSDIPAWLTDYNGDMQKIDSGIHAAKVQAEGAASGVTALQSAMSGKQDKLTFDSTPTSGSSNPVTSGGIYDALAGMSIATDAVPTEGSTKAVQSGGVYDALQGKQNTLTAVSSTLTSVSGASGDTGSKIYIWGDVCTAKFRKISNISSSAWTSASLSSGANLYTVSGNPFNLSTSTLNAQLGQDYKSNSIGTVVVSGSYGGSAVTALGNLVVYYDGASTYVALIVGTTTISEWVQVSCQMNIGKLVSNQDGLNQNSGGVFTFLISSLS